MRHVYLVPLFVVALAGWAAAAEIRVPQDQPTIQAAIDAAGESDVVLISKGTYAENVSVESKKVLTIQGRGGVVISPPGGTGVFIHACDSILLMGISVKGGAVGIDVFESLNVTIDKFAVSGVTGDGIRANDSTGVNVVFGKISDCGSDGIRFGEDVPVSGGQIASVKIKHCGSDGIQLTGQNLVVSKCKVSAVDDDGFETDDESAGPVRFEDCKVSGAGSDGFLLSGPGTTAVDCSAKNCRDDGFDVEGAGSHVENCVAKGSDSRGFGVDDVDGVAVVSCKATGNGDEGFQLQNSTNSQFDSCTAKKSGAAGFSLTGTSTGNTLTGNKASGSGTFDLDDVSVGPNTLTDNQFRTTSTD